MMHIVITIIVILIILLIGRKTEMIVGKDIKAEQISQFYYTYSNINYNAEYQRYRFYIEEGKNKFFHETRQNPGGYGFLTEDNTTRIGDYEINKQEWDSFIELISEGRVEKRTEKTESGDSGPWMYIYWDKDKDKYQEYYFDTYDKQLKFVEYCESLIQKYD